MIFPIADDSSPFAIANNIHTSATILSQDLNAINDLSFLWKLIFNRDLRNHAQEVIFSEKSKKSFHSTLLFNNIPLSNSLFQKHLGLTLYVNLNFLEF